MKALRLYRGSVFTAEMERLRRDCFPGAYPSDNSQDCFDIRSKHISVRVGGSLEVEPGGAVLTVQPLVCEVRRWANGWPESYREQIHRIALQGIAVPYSPFNPAFFA